MKLTLNLFISCIYLVYSKSRSQKVNNMDILMSISLGLRQIVKADFYGEILLLSEMIYSFT